MWQRNKEIFVGNEKIGYITLYWDKEKEPLFYADIELAFINRLTNIKQDTTAEEQEIDNLVYKLYDSLTKK